MSSRSQDKAQNASQAEANNTVDLDTTAIGIDTNVLLLTANHNKSADIVDYLTNVHKAPFILPGQSIQEFWNNELSAVDTHGRKLSSAIGQFTSVLDAFDQDFGGIQENLPVARETEPTVAPRGSERSGGHTQGVGMEQGCWAG